MVDKKKSIENIIKGAEMLKKEMHDPTSIAHKLMQDLFSHNHLLKINDRVEMSAMLGCSHSRKGVVIDITPTPNFSTAPEMKDSIINNITILWDCGTTGRYTSETIHFHKIKEG